MTPALLNLQIRRARTYTGLQVKCYGEGRVVVPLAGYTAYAQIRAGREGALIYDLAPTIAADDAAGLITIPPIPWAITDALPPGDYIYELILQDPAGNRYDPILTGNVKISTSITLPL
jgi:hypothetical protein